MSVQPYGAFGFTVKLSEGPEQIACFQDVTGLSASVEVTDFQEGGVNNTTHKIIGHASYGNVTFKRGLVDTLFFSWISDVINGTIKRKDIIVAINKDDNSKGVSYKLFRALPIKWTGPPLSVMQDSIAVESLEVSVEGIEIL